MMTETLSGLHMLLHPCENGVLLTKVIPRIVILILSPQRCLAYARPDALADAATAACVDAGAGTCREGKRYLCAFITN
jgi:hypothetical protein